jgi:hypothetical protein
MCVSSIKGWLMDQFRVYGIVARISREGIGWLMALPLSEISLLFGSVMSWICDVLVRMIVFPSKSEEMRRKFEAAFKILTAHNEVEIVLALRIPVRCGICSHFLWLFTH